MRSFPPRRACVALALVASLVAPSDVSASSLPPPWEDYHTSDEIFAEFARLADAHPALVRWDLVSETRPPDASASASASASQGVGSVRVATITDASVPDERKARLLLVFGEHARELVTSELALWLARVLVGESDEFDAWPESRAALAKSLALDPPPNHITPPGSIPGPSSVAEWAKALTRRCVVTLVPIEVPASRRSVERGDPECARKTPAGVDLNRNWAVGFERAPGTTFAKRSEEYPGPEPFSEPESRAVRRVAMNSRPHGFANVHSGEWALYVPWDHKPARAEGLPPDAGWLLERLNAHCECVHGAGGEVSGYLAKGTSMDWMYGEAETPYPLTFELWGEHGEGKQRTSAEDDGKEAPGRTATRKRKKPLAPPRRAGGGTSGGAARHTRPFFFGRRRRLHAEEERVAFGSSSGALRVSDASFSSSREEEAPRFDDAAHRCVRMFNPPSGSEYRGAMAAWVNVVLLFADHLAGAFGEGGAAPGGRLEFEGGAGGRLEFSGDGESARESARDSASGAASGGWRARVSAGAEGAEAFLRETRDVFARSRTELDPAGSGRASETAAWRAAMRREEAERAARGAAASYEWEKRAAASAYVLAGAVGTAVALAVLAKAARSLGRRRRRRRVD